MKTKLSLTLLTSLFAFTAHAQAAENIAPAAAGAAARPIVSRLTPEVLASLENTKRSLFSEFEAAAPAAQPAQQNAAADLAAQLGNLNFNN